MSSNVTRRQILIGAAAVAAGAVLPVTGVVAALPAASVTALPVGVLDLATFLAKELPYLNSEMLYELRAVEALLQRRRASRLGWLLPQPPRGEPVHVIKFER